VSSAGLLTIGLRKRNRKGERRFSIFETKDSNKIQTQV
jgi:hypothetical protein